MEKFFIVMPAYNEEENIQNVVAQWYPIIDKINGMADCEASLVIANDGSKDKTLSMMNELASDYPYFIPIDKKNSGHGATVLYLYRYAIKKGADYVFQTDSDGQTDPEEFWQMFEHRHEFDMQIGHRSKREDGGSRVFVTKVLRFVVWLLFHEWVVDANTPFRLMKAGRLNQVMQVIPPDFFLSNVAISAIATKWKFKIQFYPITFRPRQGGVNSINMKRIIKIGWKALHDFRSINNNLEGMVQQNR